MKASELQKISDVTKSIIADLDAQPQLTPAEVNLRGALRTAQRAADEATAAAAKAEKSAPKPAAPAANG